MIFEIDILILVNRVIKTDIVVLKRSCVLISFLSPSLAGGAVFSEYSSVHLHRSEVGQDHQLALAGEIERQN